MTDLARSVLVVLDADQVLAQDAGEATRTLQGPDCAVGEVADVAVEIGTEKETETGTGIAIGIWTGMTHASRLLGGTPEMTRLLPGVAVVGETVTGIGTGIGTGQPEAAAAGVTSLARVQEALHRRRGGDAMTSSQGI